MQVSLTHERALKLKEACENLLATDFPCIRTVAQVLGLMTSSCPGVLYGPLHHKFLEMDKSQALKTHNGNFDKSMSLSHEAQRKSEWYPMMHSVSSFITIVNRDVISIFSPCNREHRRCDPP